MSVFGKFWILLKINSSKLKLFVFCCLLFCIVIGTQEARELFTIAQIQYGGGGDWYGDPSSYRQLAPPTSRTDRD